MAGANKEQICRFVGTQLHYTSSQYCYLCLDQNVHRLTGTGLTVVRHQSPAISQAKPCNLKVACFAGDNII